MNDEDFPFELVYEHLARHTVNNWPPEADAENPMPPALLSVMVEDGEVVCVVPFPVHTFFRDGAGQERMGMLLNLIVPKIPADTCMVLMSEAWFKLEQRALGQPLPEAPKGSLADDPEAVEGVMISLYRPHRTRIGNLLFDANRKPQYAPLQDTLTISGRLIPEPGPGSAPVQ